jgi:hypothetical protein
MNQDVASGVLSVIVIVVRENKNALSRLTDVTDGSAF